MTDELRISPMSAAAFQAWLDGPGGEAILSRLGRSANSKTVAPAIQAVDAVAGVATPPSATPTPKHWRGGNAALIEKARAWLEDVGSYNGARVLVIRLCAALTASEAQLSELSMEADVGKWVYSRIDALMDAKPGTAEAVELSYLTSAVGYVEEYGVENCEGHDLGGDALRAAEAENTRLREALKPFAKAAELFRAGNLVVEDVCIYRPAAGTEYELHSGHLLDARQALTGGQS